MYLIIHILMGAYDQEVLYSNQQIFFFKYFLEDGFVN